MRRGALAAVLALLAACRQRQETAAPAGKPAAQPSVLLLTVDTLRPDALGWVSGRNDTPSLDRLAAHGFRFPAAVSPVPLTFPSHAALMTGVLPRRLGLRDNGQSLGAAPETLASLLRARGYSTAAFVSGYPLARAFGLDRGFDHYDDRMTAAPEGEDELLERPARETVAAAIEWLHSGKRPFFLWVHLYDPHYPYTPPPELVKPGPRGRYDGEVAVADRSAGELLAAAEQGTPDLITVFAGDHGESLGEHGEGTHGFFLYDATVLVPLVFRIPGLSTGESRAPARLIDVTPTLLDYLGLAALSSTDGVSLRGVLTHATEQVAPAYIETYQPWLSYGWAPLSALRHSGWKLILAPRPELYDLGADAGETRDLFETNHDKAAELERLRRPIAELPRISSPGGAADAEAVARLRALGYLGGGASTSEPPASGLRDPKDGRRLRDLLTEGDERLRRRDYAGAVARFDAALAEDPGNRFALLRSGMALLAAGRDAPAAERLRRAVEANPEQPEARGALARALLRLGRAGEAVNEAQEAARLQPRRAAAWADLGTALGQERRVPEAVKALEHAVELEPGDAKLVTRLAFAEHAAGRIAEAARDLARAAALDEAHFAHAGALGILLADLGRVEEARTWLARSKPGEGDYAAARRRLEGLR